MVHECCTHLYTLKLDLIFKKLSRDSDILDITYLTI
jgi:hypothetical protein